MTGMKWDRQRPQRPPQPYTVGKKNRDRAAEQAATQSFAQIEHRTPCPCGSERYLVRNGSAKCCSCGRPFSIAIIGGPDNPTPEYLNDLRRRFECAIDRGHRLARR